jgi:SAM-dependent MidA family methyltransferase
MTHASELPSPDTHALQHSQRLQDYIIDKIAVAGGAIPFHDFMQYALYAPQLGYYSAGAHKFGEGGDFITAPELSPLFAECMAHQVRQVLKTLPDGIILEFGAGSGILAAELLLSLQALDCVPQEYWILEISPDLQQRQLKTLQQRVPDLVSRVRWLHELPNTPFKGVVLANEVLDAMPVQRFCVEVEQVLEYYVNFDGKAFVWEMRPAQDAALQTFGEQLRECVPTPYTTERNPYLSAWLQALSESFQAGVILLVDYGFPAREYYHSQRDTGTLMCHYQHRAHTDPLILLGLQDITAHVDFTAVATAAEAANLEVAAYTNQANFLLGCGLTEILLQHADKQEAREYIKLTQQTKILILPSEMGELFKVIALTRDWHEPLLGFVNDDRGRL